MRQSWRTSEQEACGWALWSCDCCILCNFCNKSSFLLLVKIRKNKVLVGSGCGACPNMQGRVWHCMDHPVPWVFCGHGSLTPQPFLANSWWTHFGHTASKAHHLIFRCYTFKGCCDVTTLDMCWSCDLSL